MTYAASGTQAGHLMYGCKASTPLPDHRLVVTLLLQRALVSHASCPVVLLGRPVTYWAVPSTKGRPGPHPLRGWWGVSEPSRN